MKLESRALREFNSEQIASAIGRIYADTPMPDYDFDGAAFERRYAFEHLDKNESRLVTDATTYVGIILLARRGAVSHISALGVAPNYRRKGVARSLVETACADARTRGDERVIVEVGTENVVAQRLYDACGFRRTQRLVGFAQDYSRAPAGPFAAIRDVSAYSVAEAIARYGTTTLPWFFDAASLFGCSLPTRGHTLDDCAFAMTTLRGQEMNLRALYVVPSRRRQGYGRRLLGTLVQRNNVAKCVVQPCVPEGLADEFFAALGFKSHLANYELELTLATT